MPIEITSLPDRGRILSSRTLARLLPTLRHSAPVNARRVFWRSVFALTAILAVAGADSLLRSYKYYSRIVDARLATGYMTSRPGLYASARQIRLGQKLSPEKLIHSLRRGGYIEHAGGSVWSASFRRMDSTIEIRPGRANKDTPSIVRVTFDGQNISQLTADNLPLESFTLEREVLSNDLTFKAGRRETLTYPEIPDVLAHAILSIEDRRFFAHAGIDPFGIARALKRNAGDDRVGQGGSTITQQLVKNTYLSPDRTFRRKFAEAMLAVALERRLSKRDIFTLYCSEVYLGQRGAVAARGVKEAARIYFDKPLKDLSLAEAATIAGMIQSPARYSPVRHPEAAHARRNTVLQAMVRDGRIDAAEAAHASSERLALAAGAPTNSPAPYFVDYVNRTSDGELDASPDAERIYTTIDLELQELAEAALKKQLDRIKGLEKNGRSGPQAALVALDPRNGHVLAMVGGRDYAESQLNRATDARRQPGSTFKPFVYAAALEDGVSPAQTFTDAPREFVYDRNKTYRPANFGGGYSMNDVTMRTGLVKSLNVVTVDVALRTGLARIANLSHSFGLPRPERYPSLALGTKEVTPLELAAAYATFVNGGRRVYPKVVASVHKPPGTHLDTIGQTEQVISPTTAYMITNMLSAVIDHGTARAARDVSRTTAVAGKTGTSRDGWFVGYTPNLVCVVWIGFDDNQQLGITGAAAALPAWADFIKGAVQLRPELGGRNFECPEGIKFVEIDADSGALSTLSCPHRELIAVTERLSPNLECFLHGNLPEPEMDSREGPKTEAGSASFAKHPPPKEKLSFASSVLLSRTQVNVDNQGRRTLSNEMR